LRLSGFSGSIQLLMPELSPIQIEYLRSLRGKNGRPITDPLEQKTLMHLVEPSNVGGTKLQTKYANSVIDSLSNVNVTTHVVHNPESTSFIFTRGNEVLGTASRKINENGLRLTSIGLEGKTGILDPLYKAESNFAKNNGLPVSARMASGPTKYKFEQYYPEFTIPKSGSYKWTPESYPQTFNPENLTSGKIASTTESTIARNAGRDLLPSARLLGSSLGEEAASIGGMALRGAGRLVGRLAGPVGWAMTAYDLAQAFPAPPPMTDEERVNAARSYRTGPQPDYQQQPMGFKFVPPKFPSFNQ